MPSLTMPTMVATGMRNPRMHGVPPNWLASTVIRLNCFIGLFLVPKPITQFGNHNREPSKHSTGKSCRSFLFGRILIPDSRKQNASDDMVGGVLGSLGQCTHRDGMSRQKPRYRSRGGTRKDADASGRDRLPSFSCS